MDISDEEWKKRLTSEEYYILRKKGTEPAWTGKYNDHFEVGSYSCAACGSMLFNSDAKFESSCGWPSFFEPFTKKVIKYSLDTSFGMKRTEISCSNCGGHLGHVFHDGPPPTGDRYCLNSVALKFEKQTE